MCWPRAVTLLPRSVCVSKEGVAIFHFVHGRPLLFHRFAGFINPSVSRVHGSCCQDIGYLDCHPHPVPDGKGGCSHTNFFFSDAIQNLKYFFEIQLHHNLCLFTLFWRTLISRIIYRNIDLNDLQYLKSYFAGWKWYY